MSGTRHAVSLAAKLEELEKKYDAHFKVVFQAIRELIYPVRYLKMIS
jgi:hypothetical protein